MEDIDNNDDLAAGHVLNEDEMFREQVIQGDYFLLYLDTYLGELFGQR